MNDPHPCGLCECYPCRCIEMAVYKQVLKGWKAGRARWRRHGSCSPEGCEAVQTIELKNGQLVCKMAGWPCPRKEDMNDPSKVLTVPALASKLAAALQSFAPDDPQSQADAKMAAHLVAHYGNENPDILRCDKKSLILTGQALIHYGWRPVPGVTNECTVVPWPNRATGIPRAQLIPGQDGLRQLVGENTSVYKRPPRTFAVYEGDDFTPGDMVEGVPPKFVSKGANTGRKLLLVFVVAPRVDGTYDWHQMWRQDLLAFRDKYARSYKGKPDELWHEDNPGFEGMCRKTVVKQAITGKAKIFQLRPRERQLMEDSDAAEMATGAQADADSYILDGPPEDLDLDPAGIDRSEERADDVKSTVESEAVYEMKAAHVDDLMSAAKTPAQVTRIMEDLLQSQDFQHLRGYIQEHATKLQIELKGGPDEGQNTP